MAANAPQTPAGDDRNLVTIDENYLAPTLEDRLQIFWSRHSGKVWALTGIVTVVLVGRYAFETYAAYRERQVQADYAAATTTAQLQAFVQTHSTAILAGVAQLRLADEAYAAGNYAAACEAYTAAAPLLADNPLAARARLGAAFAPLQAGNTATAKPALEALANDTALARAYRAEAAYHLAVVARDAGQAADATRWIELVTTVEPQGAWANRANQLRDSLPAIPAPAAVSGGASPAPAPDAAQPSSVTFPGKQ
jgi:hypothetical protein